MPINYSNLDDLTLIQMFQNGDLEVFVELVQRYKGLVIWIGKHYLSDDEEASDIFQGVFLRIWKQLQVGWQPKTQSISNWVSKIAVNLCLDFLRNRKKTIYIEDEHLQELIQENPVNSIELKDEINQIIDILSERERKVFEYYFRQDLSCADISRILDIGLKDVYSAIARIRKKFWKELSSFEEYI